jgi:hypothetical protein
MASPPEAVTSVPAAQHACFSPLTKP